MNGLLLAAVLPAIVLLVYVYRKDTVEKEPVGLIAKLFVFGMVAGPVAAEIENLAFGLFETVLPDGWLLLVLEYFIGVAAVEEGVKYFALNTVRNDPNFNYVFDGVVYAVSVALGFAALENVFYVFDGGLGVAVQRAIFAVPGHAADGAVMGCFYGLARKYELLGDTAKASSYRKYALLIPIIEHGIYDCALSTGSDLLALGALGMELLFIGVAMYLVNNMSKNDEPLPTARL